MGSSTNGVSAAVQPWLTRWAGSVRDPSLRLKNGYVQDDNLA